MKVIKKNDDGGAVIELTKSELGLIGLVGTEFCSGAYAPSDEEWEQVMAGANREEAFDLFESLP